MKAVRTIAWVIGSLLLGLAVNNRTHAQGLDPALLQLLSPEQQQQVQQLLGGKQTSGLGNGEEPWSVVVPVEPPPPVETLEAYGGLTPFGYELFRATPTTFAPATEIPVPQDYVVGPGDVVHVQLFGNENGTHRLPVGRNGQINVPKLGPVQAAGLTFDALRTSLEKRVASQMIGVRAAVTLGELRSIRVFVLGEAALPGSYTVSSLSTMTNALLVSGGVKVNGSLRNIQLKRNGKTVQTLDLYQLLLEGDTSRDARLQPGDAIFIPPVGPRVGVDGEVKRPAVYELKQQADLKAVVAMAGGLLPTSDRGVAQIERINRDSRVLLRTALDAEAGLATAMQDGDILRIRKVTERVAGMVRVSGFVGRPGPFAWREGLTVADVLKQAQGILGGIGREPYLLAGVLERTNAKTGVRELQMFDLAAIIAGANEGHELQPDDHLLIFSREDMAFLTSDAVHGVLTGTLQEAPPEVEAKDDAMSAADQQALAAAMAANPRLLQQMSPSQAAALAAAQGRSGPSGGAALPTGFRGSQSGSSVTRPLTRQEKAQLDAAERGLPAGAGRQGPLLQYEMEQPKPFATPDNCPALRELGEILNSQRSARFAIAQISQGVRADLRMRRLMPCPDIFETAPATLPFLLEHGVAVQGEVRAPGIYPVTPQTDLTLVLNAAGGLSSEADASNIELTPYGTGRTDEARRNIALLSVDRPESVSPGDLLNVRPRYTDQEFGTIQLVGEFRFPGTYTISRGETLSQVIARAGGLTDQAYPYGAVFTRERAKKAEREAYQRAASDLQEAMITAVTSGMFARETQSVAQLLNGLIARLEKAEAVGRITVETDPAALQSRPDLDLALEPGDTLHMPKRSASVTVTGQVLNPGSLAFTSGYDASDYIELAGGFSHAADRDRIFVVLPNGSARALKLSFWNFDPVKVPPGSTIVVPRDATRLSALVLTERIASIFSDLAISAAALVTISNTR